MSRRICHAVLSGRIRSLCSIKALRLTSCAPVDMALDSRQLDDAWLDFGRAGNVSAFLNQQRPESRNLFWTNPEVEIDLAAQAGVQAGPSAP